MKLVASYWFSLFTLQFCFITVYSWGGNVPVERPTSFVTKNPKLVTSLGIIQTLRCISAMILKGQVSD